MTKLFIKTKKSSKNMNVYHIKFYYTYLRSLLSILIYK